MIHHLEQQQQRRRRKCMNVFLLFASLHKLHAHKHWIMRSAADLIIHSTDLIMSIRQTQSRFFLQNSSVKVNQREKSTERRKCEVRSLRCRSFSSFSLRFKAPEAAPAVNEPPRWPCGVTSLSGLHPDAGGGGGGAEVTPLLGRPDSAAASFNNAGLRSGEKVERNFAAVSFHRLSPSLCFSFFHSCSVFFLTPSGWLSVLAAAVYLDKARWFTHGCGDFWITNSPEAFSALLSVFLKQEPFGRRWNQRNREASSFSTAGSQFDITHFWGPQRYYFF